MKHEKPEIDDLMKQHGSIYDIVGRKLAQDRIIHLFGMVSPEMTFGMSIQLRYLASVSNKPITIYLNTTGGSVTDGLGMYDTIREITKTTPVNIIAVGACMSMGAIVLQAATKRLALPHTFFLLHELGRDVSGTLSQMKDDVRFSESLQKVLNGILCKRTGYDERKLVKLFTRRDFFISAEEAKKHRLIDDIVKIA